MAASGRCLCGRRLDRGIDREGFQGHGSRVSWADRWSAAGSGRKTVAKRHRARV
jgi:hypothetical protein